VVVTGQRAVEPAAGTAPLDCTCDVCADIAVLGGPANPSTRPAFDPWATRGRHHHIARAADTEVMRMVNAGGAGRSLTIFLLSPEADFLKSRWTGLLPEASVICLPGLPEGIEPLANCLASLLKVRVSPRSPLKLPRFLGRRTIGVRGVHNGQDKESVPA
jgi:hypothetical protein